MAKYLLNASYTAEGLKALHKDTASRRKAAVEEACKSMGGKLESFYFAFGKNDVVGVVELPDNIAAASIALSVAATGLITLHTTPLMSVEDVDKALMKSPHYRPPGG